MPIVGRGDADGIDRLLEQGMGCFDPVKALKRPDAPPGCLAKLLGAYSGLRGDRFKRDCNGPKVTAVQTLGVQMLKQRPIRLLEDHPEADHADAEMAIVVCF